MSWDKTLHLIYTNPYKVLYRRIVGMTDSPDKKMSRRSYLKYIGAGAVVVAAAGGAYYLTRPPPPKTVPLHFFTGESDPDSIKAWQSIYNEYLKTHPNVAVTDEYVAWEEEDPRIINLVSAGTPPSIWYCGDAVAAEPTVRGWIDQDAVGEVVAAAGIPEQNRRKYQGKDFIAPFMYEIVYMWYRTDVFEKYGVQAPKTWKDLLDVCETIDNPTGMRANAIVCGAIEASMEYSAPFWWGNGVRFMDYKDGDWQVTLDEEPYMSRAVETLEYLYELHKYSAAAPDWSYSELLDAFSTEKVAITYYIGARVLNVVIDRNPAIEFKMAPFQIPCPRENVTLGGIQGYTLFKQKDPEVTAAAKDLTEYMLTPAGVMPFLLSVPYHEIPADPKIYEDPTYLANPRISNHKDIIPFLKEMTAICRNWTTVLGPDKPLNPYLYNLCSEGNRLGAMQEKRVAGQESETIVKNAAQEMRDQLAELKIET